MTRYEAAAPAPAVDRYLTLLRTGDFDTIYAESGFEPTVFTGKADYIAYLRELYREPENLHTVEKASDAGKQKQYIVYRGDERVSLLYLDPAPEGCDAAWRAHRAALPGAAYTYTVSPPSCICRSAVWISPSSGLTGEEVRTEYYAGIDDHAVAPSLLRYRVEGLLVPPDAQAFTDRGVAVPSAARSGRSPRLYGTRRDLAGEEPEMLALAEKDRESLFRIFEQGRGQTGYTRPYLQRLPISMTPLRASTTTGTAPIPPIASKISGCTISELFSRRFHGRGQLRLCGTVLQDPEIPTHYTMTFLRIDGRWQLTDLQADDNTQGGTTDQAT